MQYLDASEYVLFGLGADTADSLVTAASALIDGFCRRPSLGVTQYVERFRPGRAGSVQMSYAPLASLVAIRVRFSRRCADAAAPLAWAGPFFVQEEVWIDVDPATIDVAADGVLTLPPNLFGHRPAEVEATYTAGYSVLPDVLKVACAQIVRNAEATPALNVSRHEIDNMRMEYFSGTLLDADVQTLLQPFRAERMG